MKERKRRKKRNRDKLSAEQQKVLNRKSNQAKLKIQKLNT
jgi:hypothetical protein